MARRAGECGEQPGNMDMAEGEPGSAAFWSGKAGASARSKWAGTSLGAMCTAHYRESVQLERRKTYRQFGLNRTMVSVTRTGVGNAMSCEAMSLSMVVWLG